jgi:DNA helicase HerA-like ATPase
MQTVSLKKIPQADMNYYFQRLFPPVLPTANPRDKYDIAIEQRHIYIYGKQGRGKTNVTKLIVNRAVEFYGSNNVSIQRTNAEYFGQILEGDWEKKPIQIIILEDATDIGIPKDQAAAFFRIRHKMFEKTGLREGLCLMVFCCHRLHETPIALRSDYDSLLILGAPMNDWDINFIESKVGEESIKLLDDADERGEKGNIIVTYRRKFLGITKIPKLMFNVPIRDVDDPTPIQVPQTIKVHQEPPLAHHGYKIRHCITERVLFALLLATPWLMAYAVLQNRTLSTALQTIEMGVAVSGAYIAVRFHRIMFGKAST